MLFRQRFLDGIRDGTITLAFRRWRRPSVRSGGTLLTPIGQLSIMSVDEVAVTRISDAEAQRAGYGSRDDLLADLQSRDEGTIYRIELGAVRADPRVRLRQSASPSADEIEHIRNALNRLDERSAQGAWTDRTLDLIRSRPGVRAGDLCRLVGLEMLPFKQNVRKLKALGLTESLEVGYRLSPRGVAFMQSSSG
jgi:hypothetical protein